MARQRPHSLQTGVLTQTMRLSTPGLFRNSPASRHAVWGGSHSLCIYLHAYIVGLQVCRFGKCRRAVVPPLAISQFRAYFRGGGGCRRRLSGPVSVSRRILAGALPRLEFPIPTVGAAAAQTTLSSATPTPW